MSRQELHLQCLACAAHYTLSLTAAEARFAHAVLRIRELDEPRLHARDEVWPVADYAIAAIATGVPGHRAARVYREMRLHLDGRETT